jgi:small-conductance mechanosensitive channel
VFDWKSYGGLAIASGIAIVAAFVVIVVTALIVRVASRHHNWGRVLASTARHPYRLLMLVIALWIAVTQTLPNETTADKAQQAHAHHFFVIATIAVSTWFLAALVSFVLGLAMGRYRTDVPDNRLRRRLRTQLIIVRRLSTVVIVLIGISSILLTFPGVQAVGTSVLASAGVFSVVAGLAAQSTLGNVFAGVQLAFSDAIRVDDVVIAQGEWGKIEEITLTYVVVHIWDDRRLVLPSTYFTTTPFENWTRHSSELLGSIELDLDWRVSPSHMREQLDLILARTALWDKRASVLQVTDAVGGYVRIRILVTAVDAPTLFDLRCFVREQMVEWLHEKNPVALPRNRVQLVEQEARPTRKKGESDTGGLFTGTPEAEERASQFTSQIEVPPKELSGDQ